LAHDWTISPSKLNHITLYYNRQIFFNNPAPDAAHTADMAKAIGLAGISTVGFPQIEWVRLL
jgi:hypothetical protein